MKRQQVQQLEDVVFNAWDKGIGDHPVSGNGDMRNCDNSKKGILKINNIMKRLSQPAASVTFTADASTDILTLSTGIRYPSGYGATSTAFTLSTTGVLPAGLSAATTYFAIDVSSNTIKVASSLANSEAGTAINITDAGTGVHTLTLIVPTRIKKWANNITYGTYAIDSTGRVWRHATGVKFSLVAGNTLTNGDGSGIAIYKDYLFVWRLNTIDCMKLADGTWTNGWQSMSSQSTSEHFPISGIDDAVYFVDGRYVGSIEEVVSKTFDPADGTTFVYTAQALDLPSGLNATCLTEIGSLLLVHTNNDTCYPWDRISSTYNDPLDIPAKGIYFAITVEDVCYILAGKTNSTPTFFVTNGYTTKFLRLLPRYLFNPDVTSSSFAASPSGACYLKNRILFGMQNTNIPTGGNYGSGIYSLDLETQAVQFERKVTAGYGTVSGISFDTLFTKSNIVYASWNNGADNSNGTDSDYIDNFAKYGNYAAYTETDLRQVGTAIRPRPFKQMEVLLEKKMISADGVKISYRTGLDVSFTDFLTFDYATFGAQDKIVVPFLMTAAEIQLKVSLTGTDGSGGVNDSDSVGVREVRLR